MPPVEFLASMGGKPIVHAAFASRKPRPLRFWPRKYSKTRPRMSFERWELLFLLSARDGASAALAKSVKSKFGSAGAPIPAGGAPALPGAESLVFFEAVRDVFEKDEAEEGVLALGCVHVAAEIVGREPELRFEAKIGGGAVPTIAGASRHSGVAVLSVGIGKSKESNGFTRGPPIAPTWGIRGAGPC